MANPDRPIVSCSETQNNLRANKTTLRNKMQCNNSGNAMHIRKLKNIGYKPPKNVILEHLNVNFLRNKIEAVEELMQSHIDISLSSEIKLDETFPNKQLKSAAIKCLQEIETNMVGVLCFTSMKMFFAKQQMLKAFPMNVKSL